jgi:hypothetical protein
MNQNRSLLETCLSHICSSLQRTKCPEFKTQGYLIKFSILIYRLLTKVLANLINRLTRLKNKVSKT